MSGDRLAQIEEHLASPLIGWTELENRDVLVLVEIARKAQRLVNGFTELQSLPGVIGTIDGEAVSELRDELARLDRSSSDGTADGGAAE